MKSYMADAPALATIQRFLYRLITAPNGVDEGLRNEMPAVDLESIIAGDDRLSARERVGIYANAYFYRLLDVFREEFPATLAVLGDINFHNLITGYLIEYPPTEPSMYYAGRYLDGFLRKHPMGRRWEFIVDLASLERTTIEVFHGSNAEALDTIAMRTAAPEEWPAVKLRIHPAARILDLEWEVDRLLRAVENGEAWSEPAAGRLSILAWRHDSRVHYRRLERAERAALKLASEGAAFAEICEAVVAELDESADAAAAINAMLSQWLRDGVLMRVKP